MRQFDDDRGAVSTCPRRDPTFPLNQHEPGLGADGVFDPVCQNMQPEVLCGKW